MGGCFFFFILFACFYFLDVLSSILCVFLPAIRLFIRSLCLGVTVWTPAAESATRPILLTARRQKSYFFLIAPSLFETYIPHTPARKHAQFTPKHTDVPWQVSCRGMLPCWAQLCPERCIAALHMSLNLCVKIIFITAFQPWTNRMAKHGCASSVVVAAGKHMCSTCTLWPGTVALICPVAW